MVIDKVESEYLENQMLHRIDVYIKGQKRPKIACFYCHDSRKVIIVDKGLVDLPSVREELKKIKGELCSRFPNGFKSYQEVHYEISSAISFEIRKDKPQGIVNEKHEASGHGGLYELAEELTLEFETMHKDREWNGEFFEEIGKFIDEKI